MSWWIRVAKSPGAPEDTLAVWESGADRWANERAQAGKLLPLKSGGYPSVFVGTAADLLPCLQSLEQQRVGEQFSKYQERIDKCPPTAELLIELWDQS